MAMPAIRYTHARDGTRIAYTIIPGASPPWLHVYSIGAPTIELDFSVGARPETHVRPQLASSESYEADVDGFQLSARERDILRLLAHGQTNAQIANELTLSTRTVERHVQNIYDKLGVHNRVEAASWALRHRVG